MIDFRLRDLFWVWTYRLLSPAFGSFGRGVRLERPLHLVGARHMHFDDGADVQNGAYFSCQPLGGSTPELRIGKGALIGHHAHIVCTRRVAIGARVLTADRIFIADNAHEYRDTTRPIADQGLRQLADVEIGEGSWIGENACIIGCRIGLNCVIAANSVVTRDVPDFTVVAGAPAIPIRRFSAERGVWLRTDREGAFVE